MSSFYFHYSKAINRAYGEYVLRVGDFDETIFLENYATEEIGTPRNQSDFSDGIPMDRSIHQHLDEVSVYKNYLLDLNVNFFE